MSFATLSNGAEISAPPGKLRPRPDGITNFSRGSDSFTLYSALASAPAFPEVRMGNLHHLIVHAFLDSTHESCLIDPIWRMAKVISASNNRVSIPHLPLDLVLGRTCASIISTGAHGRASRGSALVVRLAGQPVLTAASTSCMSSILADRELVRSSFVTALRIGRALSRRSAIATLADLIAVDYRHFSCGDSAYFPRVPMNGDRYLMTSRCFQSGLTTLLPSEVHRLRSRPPGVRGTGRKILVPIHSEFPFGIHH